MPELPDITIYVERSSGGSSASGWRECGSTVPFVLRTFEPPLEAASGKLVRQLRRVGKRIAIGLETSSGWSCIS